MKYANEMKIGVFVLSGLFLLLFGWAYLREFAMQVQHNFMIIYDDVSGLNKGAFVRINGLRVGRVDNLTLDIKQNKVLVEVRIQIPGVNVPKDSMMYIRSSGYVGDKYLDVALGMSNDFIHDGDIVVGEPVSDPFQSLEVVSKILNSLDPKLVGNSIQDFSTGAANLVKKADGVIDSTDKVVMSLPQGEDLKVLVEKAHDTVAQLNHAIDSTQAFATNTDAQNNLSMLLSQASVVSSDLNQTLKNASSLANNKVAFENANSLLLRANKIIEQLDELKADPLIQNDLRETLNNANQAAKKISTTSDEVSNALNSKFLLPRLFFGKVSPSKKDNKKTDKKED